MNSQAERGVVEEGTREEKKRSGENLIKGRETGGIGRFFFILVNKINK
jgi:hypothetical protein